MWREKKIKYYIQGSVTNVVDELHSKEMTFILLSGAFCQG
jgi:hypothetical protein